MKTLKSYLSESKIDSRDATIPTNGPADLIKFDFVKGDRSLVITAAKQLANSSSKGKELEKLIDDFGKKYDTLSNRNIGKHYDSVWRRTYLIPEVVKLIEQARKKYKK